MEVTEINNKPVDPDKQRRAKKEVEAMSITDNAFFVNVMKSPELFSHILSLILGEKMDVIGEIQEAVDTEKTFTFLKRKDTRLDAVAVDSKGNICHIEMENTKSKATPKRARFYSAALTADALQKGEDYENLKRQISIYLVDGDALGKGRTVDSYRMRSDEGDELSDGVDIIFVDINGEAEGELGEMLRCLKERDAYKMGDEILRKAVSYAKGDEAMQVSIYDTKIRFSEETEKAILEQGRQEGIALGIEQGIEQGVMQEKIRMVLSLASNKVSAEIIASSTGFSIDEVDKIIKDNN